MFTFPSVCKIHGLNNARTRLQTVYIFIYFQSCNPSTFNVVRFDKNPFTRQSEKEEEEEKKKKKASAFQISHFYRSFVKITWQRKG